MKNHPAWGVELAGVTMPWPIAGRASMMVLRKKQWLVTRLQLMMIPMKARG